MPLKCPHCEYVWTPRVSNPKSCPKCKQPFRPGRQPIDVSVTKPQPVSNEMLTTPFNTPQVQDVGSTTIVGKNDKPGRIYGVCNEDLKNQLDVEAPYIFEDNVVCLYHLIEAVLKYDDYYDYKKPDVIGSYERHRRKFKDALRQVLKEHTSAPPE